MNVLRLKGTMLTNKVKFLEKTVFFLVRPETYFNFSFCARDAQPLAILTYPSGPG